MMTEQDPVALAKRIASKGDNYSPQAHVAIDDARVLARAVLDLHDTVDVLKNADVSFDELEGRMLKAEAEMRNKAEQERDAAHAEAENLEAQLHEAHRLHDDLRTSVADARAEALALRRDGEYLHREYERLRGALEEVRRRCCVATADGRHCDTPNCPGNAARAVLGEEVRWDYRDNCETCDVPSLRHCDGCPDNVPEVARCPRCGGPTWHDRAARGKEGS